LALLGRARGFSPSTFRFSPFLESSVPYTSFYLSFFTNPPPNFLKPPLLINLLKRFFGLLPSFFFSEVFFFAPLHCTTWSGMVLTDDPQRRSSPPSATSLHFFFRGFFFTSPFYWHGVRPPLEWAGSLLPVFSWFFLLPLSGFPFGLSSVDFLPFAVQLRVTAAPGLLRKQVALSVGCALTELRPLCE